MITKQMAINDVITTFFMLREDDEPIPVKDVLEMCRDILHIMKNKRYQ